MSLPVPVYHLLSHYSITITHYHQEAIRCLITVLSKCFLFYYFLFNFISETNNNIVLMYYILLWPNYVWQNKGQMLLRLDRVCLPGGQCTSGVQVWIEGVSSGILGSAPNNFILLQIKFPMRKYVGAYLLWVVGN